MSWEKPDDSSGVVVQRMQLEYPSAFQESNEQATNGTVYYAMNLVTSPIPFASMYLMCSQGDNVASGTCQDVVCRSYFVENGGIVSTNNDTYRPIEE